MTAPDRRIDPLGTRRIGRVRAAPLDALYGVALDLDRWADGWEAAEYSGWAADFRAAADAIRAAARALEHPPK